MVKKIQLNQTDLYLDYSNPTKIHLFKFEFYFDPYFIDFSDQISILVKQIFKIKKKSKFSFYLLISQIFQITESALTYI